MNDSRDPLAQLVDADRTLPGPDVPALDRVWSGIDRVLASGAPGPALDTQPLLASSGGWTWGVLTVVVLAVAGTGLAVAGARAEPIVSRPGLVPPVPQIAAQSVDPPSEPEPLVVPSEPAADIAESPVRRSAPRPRSKQLAKVVAKPSLMDEVALMRSLGQALARGDNKQASKLLRQHEREFPKGALLEERRAAAVRIACARNDHGAATRRAAFERRWPESMHAAAIRKACED